MWHWHKHSGISRLAHRSYGLSDIGGIGHRFTNASGTPRTLSDGPFDDWRQIVASRATSYMVKLKRAAIARTPEKSGIGGGEQRAQRLAWHWCTGTRSESEYHVKISEHESEGNEVESCERKGR